MLGTIAWHAQGLEFLTELANSFESKLIELKLLPSSKRVNGEYLFSVLLMAQDPAALIESSETDDAQRNMLVRFPERGYLIAAKELFDERLVGELTPSVTERVLQWMRPNEQEIPRWRQLSSLRVQKVFLATAVDLLERACAPLSQEAQSILNLKGETWREMVIAGDITEEKYFEKYEAARKQLMIDSGRHELVDEPKFLAIARAELVAVLWRDGASEASRLAYLMVEDEGFSKNWAFFSNEARIVLSKILMEKPRFIPLLEELQSESLALLALDDSQDGLNARADVMMILADLAFHAGKLETALQWQEEVVIIRQKLMAISETFAVSMARDVYRLGSYQRKAGLQEMASKRYHQGLQLLDRLLSEGYDSLPLQMLVIAIKYALAQLDHEAGRRFDSELARSQYVPLVLRIDELIAEYGDTKDLLRSKSLMLSSLAEVSPLPFDSARKLLDEARAINDKIKLDYGVSIQELRDNYRILIDSAEHERLADRPELSLVFYEESLRIQEEILSEFGISLDRGREMADTFESLAKLNRAAGAMKVAQQWYSKCLAAWDRVSSELGETLVGLENRIRIIFRTLELLDRALQAEEYRQAASGLLGSVNQLLNEFGVTRERLRQKNMAIEVMFAFSMENGEIEAARKFCQDGLMIEEAILFEFGDSDFDLWEKANWLHRLAGVDLEMMCLDSARVSCQQSMLIRERLFLEFGGTVERLFDKAASVIGLADIEKASGDLEAARVGYLEGMETLLSHGSTKRHSPYLIHVYRALGEMDELDGNINSALNRYREGYNSWDYFSTMYGALPECERDRKFIEHRLAILIGPPH